MGPRYPFAAVKRHTATAVIADPLPKPRYATNEYRCPECKKLLFVGSFTGHIETDCHKCKKLRRFEG